MAIQNGMEPNRVAYFPLAPSLDRVTGERVLERGNRNFEKRNPVVILEIDLPR